MAVDLIAGILAVMTAGFSYGAWRDWYIYQTIKTPREAPCGASPSSSPSSTAPSQLTRFIEQAADLPSLLINFTART